jgi:hypothetical protein
MTGMDEGQVRLFIKKSGASSFFFDPVTSSVIYKKHAPLFNEINKLYSSLQAKFLEEQASLSFRGEAEDDEEGLIGKMGRIKSGDRSGGFGRMGGGRMRDF